MKRILGSIVSGLIVAALAVAVVFAGTLGGWWRSPLAPRGDTEKFTTNAIKKLEQGSPGNAAFVVVSGGRPIAEHFISKGAKVDRDTQFQVASLSKGVTAWGVMSLVDQGKLDLDAPVSSYLKRWKLPPSQFDNNKVTVRRLLSHTAGLTDGLGYGGFKPGETVQSLESSLTKASDASPGAGGEVKVGREPGEFDYSGGGSALQ